MVTIGSYLLKLVSLERKLHFKLSKSAFIVFVITWLGLITLLTMVTSTLTLNLTLWITWSGDELQWKFTKKIRDTLFLACFQAQLKVALHVLAYFYAKYITYLFIRMYIKQEDLTQWIRHFCSQCQFRKVREAAFTRKPIDHQHGERWSIDIM